jgi:hypothetical protein
MTTPRTAHRRTSGSIRHLSSGSWQARYTGPDGALRALGTFPTKVETDQALPAAVREAWLAETGGVVAADGPRDRNVGRTEAARAYRLLHTGMAQAVADGLIPSNPCLVKGAGPTTTTCCGLRAGGAATRTTVKRHDFLRRCEATF